MTNSKRKSSGSSDTSRGRCKPATAHSSANDVPSLPLSDALLFADPSANVLVLLSEDHGRWMEAVVLGKCFWDDSRWGDDGKLNQNVHFRTGVPPLTVASIKFDPDRLLKLTTLSVDTPISAETRHNLHPARRLQLLPLDGSWEFLEQTVKAICQIMPDLTSIKLADGKRLDGLCALQPLGSLHSLERLTLHQRFDGDSSSLRGLKSLRTLSIYWGGNLSSDVGSLTHLRVLRLLFCYTLTEISPLASLCSLTHLTLYGCLKLGDLSPLSSLISLRELRIELRVGSPRDVAALAPLHSLEFLDLSGFKDLVDLAGLSPLAGLRALILNGADDLTDLSPLSSLSSLSELCISDMKRLVDITPIGSLRSLDFLSLDDCETLQDVGPLASLTELMELSLSGSRVADMSQLLTLTRLEKLNLRDCNSIVDLSGLHSMGALKELNLIYCQRLVNVSSISSMTSLQRLEFLSTYRVEDLSVLASVPLLNHLSISTKPEQMASLHLATSLRSVNLFGNFDQAVNLDALSMLTSLHRMEIAYCKFLTDLTGLAGMRSLVWLNIPGASELTDLLPLASLRSLRVLYLTDCERLEHIAPLAALTSLQSLALSGVVRDISPLASLQSLERLSLDCKRLHSVRSLAKLKLLRHLDIRRCSSGIETGDLQESLPELEIRLPN